MVKKWRNTHRGYIVSMHAMCIR